MNIVFVNGILSVFSIINAWKRKQYRYAVYATLSLLYFLLAWLHSDYDLIGNANLFGHIHRLILLVLCAFTVYSAIKPLNKKLDIKIAVFACAAFAFRVLRTVVVRVFTAQMQVPGADAVAINQSLTGIYLIVDGIVNFSIVLMLFVMVMHFGKANTSNV